MKAFETPVVDVKKFDVMDVLTASTTPDETEEIIDLPVMVPPCI